MPNEKTTGSSAREEKWAKFTAYRIRMLPDQLDRAYRRVEQLENEARALKMDDIIRRPTNASNR